VLTPLSNLFNLFAFSTFPACVGEALIHCLRDLLQRIHWYRIAAFLTGFCETDGGWYLLDTQPRSSEEYPPDWFVLTGCAAQNFRFCSMFSQKKPEKHHINANFEQEWLIFSGKAPQKRKF